MLGKEDELKKLDSHASGKVGDADEGKDAGKDDASGGVSTGNDGKIAQT
jgi:hypothetical protein